MAHAQTKDPFGFVGSHVIHQRSRRRSAAGATGASRTSSSFGVFGSGIDGAAAEGGNQEEHGWITRYDARLDSYTLFVPGKGASVHSRGDVMKLIADPSFLVQNDDEDEFPAPIEDTTSRYVDVPMVKTVASAADVAISSSSSGGGTVRGVVKCYLPFADLYRVDFDDKTSEEVSEDAIINSMIAILRSQQQRDVTAATQRMADVAISAGSKKRKRAVDALAPSATAVASASASQAMAMAVAMTTPPATVRSVSAPVVSVTVPPPSMMPVSYAAVLGMDSSPVVTHSNILELVAARNASTSASISSSSNAPPTSTPALPPSLPLPLPRVPAATPKSLFIKNEPSPASAAAPAPSSSSGGNIIMLIDDEPAVEMIPFDVDDDVVMMPVESSSSSSPDSAAVSASDSWTSASTRPSTEPPPFYLITEEPSQMVELLETRSLAYKYVRDELLNLLDRKEASAKKIAMQYDILRNPDIKHISSIKRFTEASGLVVLNHLISTYLAEHEVKPRDADLLLLLKIVAMLPIPARKHVADSKIALTIGKLAKPRSLEMYPKLPLAITHLAKWIKRKWTEHFSKLESQERQQRPGSSSSSKSGHPSQRLGTRTAPPGSAGQRSSRPTEISDRLVDTQPIPRLASRPALAEATGGMGNPIAGRPGNMSLPLSNGGVSAGRKSSLKPDWMRQQEALRRTRFTSESSQDSTAEYNHYKRVRRADPSSSSAQPLDSSSSNISSAISNSFASADSFYAAENEQAESAGGARGTFGRNQKLSFGSRWSVAEFYRDAPPSSVRPATSRYQQQSQSQQRHGRPRSILRRQSKYEGNLDSIR